MIVIGAAGGAVGIEGQFRVHDDGLGYSVAVEEANRVFQMIEGQSHRFAGAFLLPAGSFWADLGALTLDRCLAIKSKWCVSVQAMIMRAGQMGTVSEEQGKRLWMNLGRRKWRTREPLDDLVVPEHPKFLGRSIELLVQNNIVDPLDIPRRLAVAARDVEELAGLPVGYLGASGPSIRLLREENGPHVVPFEREAE